MRSRFRSWRKNQQLKNKRADAMKTLNSITDARVRNEVHEMMLHQNLI